MAIKLRLKQRMYLQFFLAVLPLAIVFSYQMLSTSELPEKIDRALSIFDMRLQASANFKSFLNGVIDAVDTGKLSSKTLASLADSKGYVAAYLTASPNPDIEATAKTLDKILEAVTANNSIEAITPLRAEINSVDKALAASAGDLKTQLSVLVEDENRISRNKNRISVGVALSTLLLIAFIVRQMVNGITRPIGFAVRTARHVSNGDLTSHIEVIRHDEIGELQQALYDMNEALIAIVGNVRGATDSIATCTKQIAAGNSDLSQRTEEQATSLQETASSMEEMTATVKQNADNAKQANQLAANASDVAIKGGQVVGEVVQTMASISDSSRKIVDIISVIEGIAFQTNILALNAAVEAARAGEQGRGFAVVAGEVRNLAQRSAAAAKEIKTLIGDSVNKVNTGSKLVDQAGATMSEIVTAVKRVTDIMSEISAASDEQSTGIEHVSQEITHMDETTQQNAALVEQAAAAAESMEEQANTLMEAVSMFKLNTVAGAARTAISKHMISTEAAPAHIASTEIATTRINRNPVRIKESKDSDWKEF